MSVIPDAVRALERDLRGIFGSRLQSLVIYGQRASPHAHGGPAEFQELERTRRASRAAP